MAENIRQAAIIEGMGEVQPPTFLSGAVNDHLTAGSALTFDRLHGGYMMNRANATKYVRENLKDNGVAVLNVGRGNMMMCSELHGYAAPMKEVMRGTIHG